MIYKMGHPDYRNCKACGQRSAERGQLSWTRLCESCSQERLTDNVLGLHYHRGPAFRRWREGVAASVGAVLLDAIPASPQTGDDA